MKRRIDPAQAFHPRYVVWELTLKCDLACRHCGSRAGRPRHEELNLTEQLDLLGQLVEMGVGEIAFIGGEAYLHPDFLTLVRAVAEAGVRPTMTTGARALDAALAQAAAKAGMQAVSVSIDGLESTHDHLRAVPGSFKAAMAALGHIRDAGMAPYANTQVNRLNLPELTELSQALFDAGIKAWQIQVTGPMGRAADRPEWLLQPYELLDLGELLTQIGPAAKARGCTINAGNNLGYYGPAERHLRIEPYGGCGAGRFVLGVESNGDVKGCPSLPSAPYVGGNVREAPLAEIWERQAIGFARARGTSELWGFCKTCYYAEVCQGGCSWTAHALLGRRGNMPWCLHRADTLRSQGRRERLVQVKRAPGDPFDFGAFELIEEPWDAPLPS
ncbi:MAG: radical SAM protein [Deltaproteobacteria bacterium]|nr:radical SAM protein [Deltaproteobacteria bacterium]